MKIRIILQLISFGLVFVAAAQQERVMDIDELFSLVEQSSALRAGRANVEAASHGVDEALAERYPGIDLSLSVSYNGTVLMTDRDFGNGQWFSQPHLGNSFTVQVEQVVYSGGAITSGINIAKLGRKSAETKVQLTRSQQRYLALGQYLDLFCLENRAKVYRENIALTDSLIGEMKARYEQGMALLNDVTRYELQMSDLRLALRRTEDRIAIINHSLCNTLGLENVRIVPDTTLLLDMRDSRPLEQWRNLAVESPGVRLSQIGVEIAKERIRMSKSDLLPKVALFAADNFSGPYQYDIPPIDNNFNVWYFGIGVKYSLSSLYKSNRKVSRAKATAHESAELLASSLERSDNNIHEAFTLYHQTCSELDTRRKSVELATLNYGVVRDRYFNSLALVTDMIDASNVKLDAELQEVDTQIRIVYALFTMKYITGEM